MGPLSENLARIRKARDLSQEALAEAADVGVDTVARIEQGTRTTTRPETARRLAATLGVSVDMLLGNLAVASFATIDVAPLRRAITSDGQIPGLLVDARRLIHAGADDDRAAAYRVLSTAYRLGAGMAGRLDLDDLAWTSAERALDAARYSDAPDVESAISIRYLAWTLVRQGRTEEAERVAIAAAQRIQPRMFDRDATKAGVFGNLLFNAATAALVDGNASRADDLLAEAHAAAVRATGDTATEAAIFGPRVAAMQQIDSVARGGDPERALRSNASVPAAQGEVPAFWEAGHRLRLAAAALELRRDSQALEFLSEARDLAPAWVRHQPLGEATMRRLVDRAVRRRGPLSPTSQVITASSTQDQLLVVGRVGLNPRPMITHIGSVQPGSEHRDSFDLPRTVDLQETQLQLCRSRVRRACTVLIGFLVGEDQNRGPIAAEVLHTDRGGGGSYR